ncbi:hypothetical protein BDK51DRAFT_28159, partial [Blyttiomyces helicus]
TIPAGWTAFLYTLAGSIRVGDSSTPQRTYSTVVLSKEGNTLKVRSGHECAHFVVVAGEPIYVVFPAKVISSLKTEPPPPWSLEPIVQHGPFVMNQQHEIYEAMLDYQAGRNGFENAARWASEIGKKRIR